MVNKNSLWFLTLFSLILVLSVYYITMPSELLLTNNNNFVDEEEKVVVSESSILVALRVEADAVVEQELESLQEIITDVDSSTEDKNNAFEKMQDINLTKGLEESIETEIKQQFNLESFVKIDADQVRVVVTKDNLTTTEANDIMRFVQTKFDTKMYISVKYQK